MSAMEQLSRMTMAMKVSVLFVVALVLGLGFWFFYYSPAVDDLEKLQKKHSKLERTLDEAERRKNTYEKDRQRRDELKKATALQLQMLPPDTEMSSFLENLNTQAELVGLEILSVKPLQEQSARYYARIPVKLQLEGSFHQISKFFYLVGNLDRIINIEDITLSISSMDEAGSVLKAKALATTFRSIELDTKKKKKKKKG